jgi:hypothetical protein
MTLCAHAVSYLLRSILIGQSDGFILCSRLTKSMLGAVSQTLEENFQFIKAIVDQQNLGRLDAMSM